jgi:hypothetical protein
MLKNISLKMMLVSVLSRKEIAGPSVMPQGTKGMANRPAELASH